MELIAYVNNVYISYLLFSKI